MALVRSVSATRPCWLTKLSTRCRRFSTSTEHLPELEKKLSLLDRCCYVMTGFDSLSSKLFQFSPPSLTDVEGIRADSGRSVTGSVRFQPVPGLQTWI